MKKTVKLFSLLMVICMLLSSCAQSVGEVASTIVDNKTNNNVVENVVGNTGSTENVNAEQLSASLGNEAIPEKGTYNEGVALVKYDGEMNDNVLSQLNLVSATALYSGSTWYTVELAAGADTVETVSYLRELGCFEKVDYDYIMNTGADTSEVNVSSNPDYSKEYHHGTHKIPESWEYMNQNNSSAGGSTDVIVAVIDTGVDYNHIDLRKNIWVNSAEIPNNGKDDDGNGYVDDIYGWDCYGNDNNPMDDNGHGTHVAGIIAAENNNVGVVGIAYNCKIMILKASNPSGQFSNSDIAEAIQYAYMNGASVINMSFGGAKISVAVEEALENAYSTCVLVAAAGNSSMCNNVNCPKHAPNRKVMVSYPAAHPCVIGVMSCNANGSAISQFSNFDHYPFDAVEYEVFACGENIPSTYPNNKYTSLSGTSMATPVVSAIAALLRSAYPDRNTYSNKYIHSQIVNAGTVFPDGHHSIANSYEALTKVPTPAVNLYEYTIDDSTAISSKNNGNGVVDAGETVRLYISLQNRGGVASNVTASIHTKVDSLQGYHPDFYFTLVNETINLSDIGTYSVRKATEEQYFEIIVADDCPNNYCVNFCIDFTYKNGMNGLDTKTYSGEGIAQFYASNGYHLPNIISESTTFPANRLYIVSNNVTIPEGVTVTFEEGCQIQFYDESVLVSPVVSVYGNLIMQGSKEKMISIYPSETFDKFACFFVQYSAGAIRFDYVDALRIDIQSNDYHSPEIYISNSNIYNTGAKYSYGGSSSSTDQGLRVKNLENNCILDYGKMIYAHTMNSNVFYLDVVSQAEVTCSQAFTNNIVYTYNDTEYGRTPYKRLKLYNTVCNNKFISANDVYAIGYLEFKDITSLKDNYFSELYREHADTAIVGYIGSDGQPIVDVFGECSDISILPSHVINIEFFNSNGEAISVVGKEKITVKLTFNRVMDTTQEVYLMFGSKHPYADYRIDGEWISETQWEGSYYLTAQIENGQNYLRLITNGVREDWIQCDFNIDTTEALSMNLQAIAKENGIELTFAQDDYDTLLGYNIYRSESKDGNYVKLNPAILLPTDETFLDENAEPGKTYWYTYTVVLTDFSESNPAGKVMATAMDTLAPNMYHTPVNQGYMNNNLVISCTATDNMAISTVTLYYRTVGATEWKTLNMAKQSDKYSATIFGSDLTLDGIEYYIVASDGRNTINKGSAEAPYTVIVKDASAISRKGDVDGDGVVTTKDALMLMQCINGDLILTDDEFKRADLNGDNVLNSSEALRILQYINGNVSTLDM